MASTGPTDHVPPQVHEKVNRQTFYERCCLHYLISSEIRAIFLCSTYDKKSIKYSTWSYETVSYFTLFYKVIAL